MQEPVELPQGFEVAIEAARNDMVGTSARLENGECKSVVRSFVLGDETGFSALERGRVRRGLGLPRSDRPRAGLRSGVSCRTFFLTEIAVELDR